MGNLWVKFSSQEASIWPDIGSKRSGSKQARTKEKQRGNVLNYSTEIVMQCQRWFMGEVDLLVYNLEKLLCSNQLLVLT